jgi:hypothetical protein
MESEKVESVVSDVIVLFKCGQAVKQIKLEIIENSPEDFFDVNLVE